jgi:hypothetical protein
MLAALSQPPALALALAPPPLLLLLLLLVAPTGLTTADALASSHRGAREQAERLLDPTSKCAASFAALCGGSSRGADKSCLVCTGLHQPELRLAGCCHEDLVALCAADTPALVVLDETLDDFGLYYQASDATSTGSVVVFYERSSGNVTLASCDTAANASSCRTAAEWRRIHLAKYYDQSVNAIDVAILPDGRVLVVFIKDFPATVR